MAADRCQRSGGAPAQPSAPHDGATLAVANNSGEIAFYDFRPTEPREGRPAAVGKERLRLQVEGFKPEGPLADFLAFLPSGDLFGGSSDGRMVLWDRDGKEVWESRRDTRVTRAFRR